jgi:hypothetical protein
MKDISLRTLKGAQMFDSNFTTFIKDFKICKLTTTIYTTQCYILNFNRLEINKKRIRK